MKGSTWRIDYIRQTVMVDDILLGKPDKISGVSHEQGRSLPL
jgi:hypothetical protein